ncbi:MULTISPECIES: DUF2057 family protein [unclassified Tatumella]|uniref:DUF2057 family protein n=1 Tax=unclassified Tatumella TaxID=2649542 RepID=UPI001BB0C190|nr:MULTISPECIES: DUF2057 family protein [unclassified Tatumella]MBS0857560.1 DUF2057 family protein [Tatumella sp. JGM16]MBS0892454.1 DUF2057 family protein [Tatumella sp. JGM130]MBS0911707.1 DUF2057 family protein [Tatumella sp. JGM91]
MKFVVTLFCLLLSGYTSAAEALSFRLNPQMNLLVLDGNKLPGSLLKGADSIELDRGQHQILFTLDTPGPSPAFIITFTADSRAVSVVMPQVTVPGALPRPLTSRFRFLVVDEHNRQLPAIQDQLPLQPATNYVAAIADYNRHSHKASVEKFVLAGSQSNPLQTESLRENRHLQLPATEQPLSLSGWSFHTLVSWLRALRTS